MRKKLLSMALAVAMVLSLLPTVAFAEEAAVHAGGFANGSMTGDEFINAAQSNKITLTGDVTLSSLATYEASDGTLEIDLAGHKLERAANGTALQVKKGTVNVINSEGTGTISGYQFAISVEGKSATVNATGVNITATGTSAAIQVNNKGTLKLTNCNVTAAKGAPALVMFKGAQGTIEGGKIESDLSGTTKVAVQATNSGTVLTVNSGEITGKNALVSADSGGKVILNGGTINQTADDQKMSAVYIQQGTTNAESVVEINDGAVINAVGGVMVSCDDKSETGTGNNKLVMKGGTITAKECAIYTNGSANSKAKEGTQTIEITGGTIKGNTAIYLPAQKGATTIKGGTITGESVGVELRGGKLTIPTDSTAVISGGDGTAATGTTPAGGGGVASNAGIAVTPYSNAGKVEVSIAGGTISGGTAFYQAVPTDGGQATYQFNITGGTFNGTNKAVESKSVKAFISGGTFKDGSKPADLTDYLKDNFTVFEDGTVVSSVGTLTIGAAPAADRSTDKVTTPTPTVAYTIGSNNTYNVTITAENVKYHLNDEDQGGYWVGFYVVAPDGATKVLDSFVGEIKDIGEGKVSGVEGYAYPVYYPADKYKTDTFTLTFYDSTGKVAKGMYTFKVDLTGVTIDPVQLESANFTYNVDKEVVGDCDEETMWIKTTGGDLSAGKYMVVVTKDGESKAFGYAKPDSNGKNWTKLSWSYVSATQTDGEGIEPGAYQVALYTYTGQGHFAQDNEDVTIDADAGTATIDSTVYHIKQIGDTKTVNVTDSIDTVTITEAKGTTAETSKAVVNAEATIEGRTITITGSAANLGENEDIQVKLNLANATDATAGTVVVKIAKGVGDDGWTNPTITVEDSTDLPHESGATFNLLTQGQPFTVKADIAVADLTIAAGKTAVDTENLPTGIQPAAATTIAGATKPADDDNTLQELATEAITTDVPETNKDDAKEKLDLVVDGGNVQTENINFFVEPHLDLAITGYDDGIGDNAKSLTIEISAVYDVIATTATTADGIQLEDGGRNKNAVVMEQVPLTVNEPIQLTVGVPSEFFSSIGQEGATVYIQHTKDGRNFHYHLSENVTSSSTTVTFTSTDGLSPFTISLNVSPAASITRNGTTTYYANLQDAVDATQNDDTITLEKDCAEAVTVGRTVRFTLATNEKNFTGTINPGAGYKNDSSDENVYDIVRVTSGGGSSGGSGSSATVNSVKATNGSFAISDKNAKAGDTVKITPKANEGYVVDQVTVTDKNGNNITVTQNADGTYSFVMPAKSAQPVDVKVTFKLDDAEKDCPSEKFTDVDQDKWYHEGVDYAIKNGLMNGTGANTFAPDATTTRAMVVTILYRLEGEPAVTKDIKFGDVPAGTWYTDAVNWAAANGIVNGYGNGKFGPDDTITREQMAAILYRYASYKGYSVSDLANLTGYTDAASVSEWASTAMRWAVAEGLIEGTSATTLSPSGDSTRAQVATILMRFCEGVVK